MSLWSHAGSHVVDICVCLESFLLLLEPPGAGVSPPLLTQRQLGFLRLLLLERQAQNMRTRVFKHTEYATLVLEMSCISM